MHVFYRSLNSTQESNDAVLKYLKIILKSLGQLFPLYPPGQLFLDAVHDNFCSQYVEFPTNYTPKPNGSVTVTSIDLILADNDSLIASVKPVGQLGSSHHVMMMVEVIVPCRMNDTEELVTDYRKADFVPMPAKVGAVDWKGVLDTRDAVNNWNYFKETVTSVTEGCIPKKKRLNNARPLWMNRNAMRVICKKTKVMKALLLNQGVVFGV